MRKNGMVLAVFLLAALLAAPAAWAKWDPRVETPGSDWSSLAQPWEAPNALTSYGLFGRLDTYGDVDAFVYSFAAPVNRFPVQVMVPVCGSYFADYYPSLALIGPGLDAPEPGALPFNLPEGTGALILAESSRPEARAISPADFVSAAYLHTPFYVDIPQAGEYIVAVFEPRNNVGAYILATGEGEPDFSGRQDEIGSTFVSLSNSDAWMGRDCSAPLTEAAAASCAPTVETGGSAAEVRQMPVRWQVGAGFVLDGDVMDGSTCALIANAQIQFWMANANGEYDAAHSGTLFSNDAGMYRIESDRPGAYSGGDAHIHLLITAPGYQPLETLYLLPDGSDTGSFPIVLQPQ